MDGKVAILVPVLLRPHRVAPFLESLEAATPEPHRTVFLASSNDRAMIAAVRSADAELEILPPARRGDYARKINHGIRVTDDPFVFAAADDLRFHPGWLPAALAPFTDPAIGVVGTQDLCNTRTIAGEHSTHLMFRRSYVTERGTIDEPGLAFHEGYWHEFVDDEAVATAKIRGAWAFAADSVVEHLHPMVGKAPSDRLYAGQGDRMAYGKRIFNRRAHMWARPRPRPSPATTAIIVATYGDESWSRLAHERAGPSAEAQHPAELILEHGPTLAEARNAGAARATTEWLCFLDADDELAPGYLDAMTATSGDLLAPAVQYIDPELGATEPRTLDDRNIMTLNPCVIGTLVRRDLFDKVGGFWHEEAFEDWSLFRRCVLAGARLEHVPGAVYIAHENRESRNNTVPNAPALMRQIVDSHRRWRQKNRIRQ